jgi:hypothetical protein
MRHHLIALAAASLAGCGEKQAESTPERQSAAGEVLGGEVSDEMLPLDSARSTSPPVRSGPAQESTTERQPGTATPAAQPAPAPPSEPETERSPLPRPEVSGGPAGRQPLEPDTPQ